MLTPGDTFAGYAVVRELGSGGMGAVYLVRHPRLPRTDALKVLRRELCADPDYTRRFLREAELVAGLSHRNVVPVLDRGEHEGQLWLTMPYVEGSDAEAALASAGGRFTPERAVHVVAEVAGALDAAHRQGLVHRDVKPANVLLRPGHDDEPEQVWLTDFGIAKPLEAGSTRLTRTGMVIATFDYASPEQVESRPLSPRSDVYSLGCVLHKLLTGSVPFPGDTLFAALHGHVSLPPPRPSALVPDLPPGLDDVVARAMAKDPEDRYPTCRALAAAALAAIGEPRRQPAPPTLIGRPEPIPPPPAATTGGPVPTTAPEVRYADSRATDAFAPADTTPVTRAASAEPGAGHDRVVPGPPLPWATPPAPRTRSRRRPAVWMASLAALALVVGAGVVLLQDRGGDTADPASTGAATGATTSMSVVPVPPTAAEAALAALPAPDAPLPDASVVVVRSSADGGTDLFTVDSTTGAATQISSGADDETSPVLSPDRRTVAFVSTSADGSRQLLATPTTGGAVADLVPLPAGCGVPLRPAWDPADPTRLALPCAADDGTRTLQVITLDGTLVAVLDVGPYIGDVGFSPDGAQVAYWSASVAGADGGSLWHVAADGTGEATQVTDSADGVDADPVWSTSGIVFRRAGADGTRSIYVVRAAGDDPQRLTEGGWDEDPTWSPDGTRIAWKHRGLDPGPTRIWTMTADGGDAAPLGTPPSGVTDVSEPAWGAR